MNTDLDDTNRELKFGKQKEALGSLNLTNDVIIAWLARKDSNLRSPAPEAGALPLGHSPLTKLYYHKHHVL